MRSFHDTSLLVFVFISLAVSCSCMSWKRKEELRDQVKEMFLHAYGSYMKNAFPGDELMPISCKGRFRSHGVGRGDIDDALGNFSLTLVDTLDTLVLLNETEEFERAVRLVIDSVEFDKDVVVSVFEVTIRMLGGLLSAHVLAKEQQRVGRMSWYKDELLGLSVELGNALLPAFDSATGVPYPRVNLKYGLSHGLSSQRHTCSACAGTMILEFASLSRLCGDPIFEKKARHAMDYLWHKRHYDSHLVGHIIDVHSGDWIRREAGIGAGSDSYYEYVLKAAILLDEDVYMQRFQTHYESILKYVMSGGKMQDVLMHQPTSNGKTYLDALIAFFPGLQVLYGDIEPAKASFDMLHKIVQKYNFLPEAFTPEPDFRIYWTESYLRPEFIESTYFLYTATKDPFYLRVGEHLINSLESLSRVDCGYAAFKDTRTAAHDDRMDSFFLAETLKYLYLLFSEPKDLPVDLHDYIFTTEAHLLPINLANKNVTYFPADVFEIRTSLQRSPRTCPNPRKDFWSIWPLNQVLEAIQVEESDYPQCASQQFAHSIQSETILPGRRIYAKDIDWSDQTHVMLLAEMGITLVRKQDGSLLISHNLSGATNLGNAAEGIAVMREIVEATQRDSRIGDISPGHVVFTSQYAEVERTLLAAPAQFGTQLKVGKEKGIAGTLAIADPETACVEDVKNISGKIAVVRRGDCMFIEKARNVEKSGAIAMIVMDNKPGTTFDSSAAFAMSGDNGSTTVDIPALFLFSEEAKTLLDAHANFDDLVVTMHR